MKAERTTSNNPNIHLSVYRKKKKTRLRNLKTKTGASIKQM